MCQISFVLSSIKGHLGCLQFFDTMNNAVTNMFEQVSLGEDRQFFVYMPNNGVAEFWSSLSPKFLMKRHIDFHTDCTNFLAYE